jgi:hypothetical protein
MAALDAASGRLDRGAEMHWLSNNALEIAQPPGAGQRRLIEVRWFAGGVLQAIGATGGISTHTQSIGGDADEAVLTVPPVRVVHITYRDLTPKDRQWSHSCYAQRPKPKKS